MADRFSRDLPRDKRVTSSIEDKRFALLRHVRTAIIGLCFLAGDRAADGKARHSELGSGAVGECATAASPLTACTIGQATEMKERAMDVGMMMVFASYGWDDCSDARVWEEEIRLARLAADLGFDCLWSAEHHFNDYSFVPDNLQLMTYLTALCPDIDLGTAAVILPWHDPLRVAENAAVLDMLSRGRLRLGLGRGLARREFAPFRLRMDESRERFDEAAPMIVNALKTGFIEGDGKFYEQPRTEIRPRPQYSFDGRIYAVASSEDSIDSAAKLGAHIVMFADRPWEMRLPAIERGRALHRKYHGTEPPQVMLTEFCVCGTDLAETEDEARRYQGKFVESNFYHYEFLGDHFKTVQGYDAYQQKAEIARKGGIAGAVAGFMQAASWGTPDKILRGLEERRKIVGDFELNVAFRFGGMPYEVAERGLKLFAGEVLPVLKAQSSATTVRAAAE
jgi:alkanesulfonate monooxygenase SsuD/methylene tetrahydromethanopterin reductase-like flavin-dependent oxidoreductase (luciferase family)